MQVKQATKPKTMRNSFRLTLATALLLVFSFYQSKAQEDLVEFFPAGAADAEILVDKYVAIMAPIVEAGINSAWYTNAQPHKKFGVEINVAFNTVFIPSEDEFWSLAPNELSNTVLTSPADGMAPTTYGPPGIFPIFQNTGTANNGISYRGTDGNDLKDDFLINAVVVPTLQMGIGIVKDTDLKIRYTPEVTIDGVTFGNYGVGLMHSIKQHIPGLKLLPFGWSLLVGYSQLNGEVDLSGEWDANGTKQFGDFKMTGLTIQTVGSKKFSVLTVYGGLGYSFGDTTFDIKGSYLIDEVTDPVTNLPVTLPDPFTLVDPFSYEYEQNSLRATLGLRLKFGPLTLHGDYTVQKTNILSFGLGFSFRED